MTVLRYMRPALAVALALASAPALAQGTQAQREACTPDAFRLCASHIPNVSAIAGCLRREEARLSPACRTAMQAATAPQAGRQVARQMSREEPAPRRLAPDPVPRRGMVGERAGRRLTMAEARARIAALRAPRSAVRPVHARYAARHHRPRYAGTRGRGFGGGSGMRQAQYWLNRLGGMGGLAGLAGGYGGGFSGASLAGIRGMRVGDIIDMMQ